MGVARPDSEFSLPSSATSHFATDEIKVEIEADMAVVSNLKDLETSFGRMIVRVKRHLKKCDLSEAKLFLCSVIGTEAFSGCENFVELLEKLQQQDHIDVFDIKLWCLKYVCCQMATLGVKGLNRSS